MRTKNLMRHLVWGVFGLVARQAFPQATQADNNGGFGSFLGWNAGAGQILDVKNEANQRIQWFTDNAVRMRLSESLTGQTIGSFTSLDLSGNLGLGNFTGGAYGRPAANFHTDFNSGSVAGWRPEIRHGFLTTRGESLCYIGVLGTAQTGVMWSRVAGTPAHFRFVYTGYDGNPSTTAYSADGLEAARFEPDASLNEAYFGIGDWTTNVLTPDERLDILDRTIRLRHFMSTPPIGTGSDYESTDPLVNRFLVADPADGRVYWKPLTANCDWEVLNANNDVVTAYSGNACPPQDDANVGIGTSSPAAKLEVVRSTSTSAFFEYGTAIHLSTPTLFNLGLFSEVTGAATSANFGVTGTADNAPRDFGVVGTATNGGGLNVGVYGFAERVDCPDFAAGVWGRVDDFDPTCGDAWAGYFEGNVQITETSYAFFHQNTSDAAIKTNVQPLTDALDVIAQLQPRTYEYRVNDYPSLNLPPDTFPGFIAQELEPVLPELVDETVIAPRLDSLGNVIVAAIPLKTVNYDGLVPYAIAGIQELNARVEAQSALIADLQDQLANCCNQGMAPLKGEGNGIGYIDNTQSAVGNTRQLNADELVVTPNPFTDNPTISYRIGTSGRAQLRVSNANGRDIGVLYDAGTEAGQHSMVWNTVGMAPGLYLLTLTVDGTRVTEQAVKVD